jgi:hypothetical protein
VRAQWSSSLKTRRTTTAVSGGSGNPDRGTCLPRRSRRGTALHSLSTKVLGYQSIRKQKSAGHDRLELWLTQIEALEAERDALIVQETPQTPPGATAMLGYHSNRSRVRHDTIRKACAGIPTIGGKLRPMLSSLPLLGKAAALPTNKASQRRKSAFASDHTVGSAYKRDNRCHSIR